MRIGINASAAAVTATLAIFTAAASATAADHSPALLARVQAGDVAVLEQAIAADLRDRLNDMFSADGELIGFTVRWDAAVCHEAEPVWVESPPVGVCLVPAGAMNVGATYAVLVPLREPVSFVLLEFAVE